MAIENGECRARALSVELCTTKNDKEQIAILFECYPLDLESKQVLGTITSYRLFEGNSEETTEKMRKQRLGELALIGFSLDTGTLVDEPPFVRLTIDEEEDQEGTLRKRVNWINALERTLNVKNVMGENQKASFLARMKAYAASTGAPVASGSAAGAEAASVAEPWDES
jgi:hypothetical protein